MNQCVKVSRRPFSQPVPSAPVSEMVSCRRSRSTISGTANMPSPTITRGTRSIRYSVPKSSRSTPVIGAEPSAPIMRPMPQAASPLMAFVPVSMPTMVSARMISIICSPKPMARMMGMAPKMATLSTSAPKTPPKSDAEKAAPSARAASPFFDSGKPSTTVACEPLVPGIPISTDGKVSEVVVTDCRPIITASA